MHVFKNSMGKEINFREETKQALASYCHFSEAVLIEIGTIWAVPQRGDLVPFRRKRWVLKVEY